MSNPNAEQKYQNPITKPLKTRLYGLDFVRFIAATGVMISHYNGYFEKTIFEPLFFLGYLGVHVFFVLSGFVIFESASKNSPILFIAGRFSRLMPAFIIASIITTIFCNIFSEKITLTSWLANLTFFPFLFKHKFIDGVYWTLSFEIHFYSMIFLMLFFKNFEKSVLRFCYFWLISSIIWSCGFKASWFRTILALDYAPLFIEGIMLALIIRKPTFERIIILTIAIILSIYNEFVHISLNNPPKAYQILIISLAILFPVFIILYVSKKNSDKFKHAFVFLGGVSYPLYLIHSRITRELVELGYIGNSISWMIGSIIFQICLAAFIYKIEFKLRSKFKIGFLYIIGMLTPKIGNKLKIGGPTRTRT